MPSNPKKPDEVVKDDWAAAIDAWDAQLGDIIGQAEPPSSPPAVAADQRPTPPGGVPELGVDADAKRAPEPPQLEEPPWALPEPVNFDELARPTRVAAPEEQRAIVALDAQVAALPALEELPPLEDEAEVEVVREPTATDVAPQAGSAPVVPRRASDEAIARFRQQLDALNEAPPPSRVEEDFYDEIAIEVLGGPLVAEAAPAPAPPVEAAAVADGFEIVGEEEEAPAPPPPAVEVTPPAETVLLPAPEPAAEPIAASPPLPAPETPARDDEFEVLAEEPDTSLRGPTLEAVLLAAGDVGVEAAPAAAPESAEIPAAAPLPTAAPSSSEAPLADAPPSVAPAPSPAAEPDPFDLIAEATASLGTPVLLPSLPEESPAPVAPPKASLRLILEESFGGEREEEPTQERDALPPSPRLSAEIAPLLLAPPQQDRPLAVDAAAINRELELLESERLLAMSPQSAARLAFWCGELAARAGDRELASERFSGALESPELAPLALRGLRRGALAAGRLDEAIDFLGREVELAAGDERAGLLALRAELLLGAGLVDGAAAHYEELLRRRADDLVAAGGLLDASTDDPRAGERLVAMAPRLGLPSLAAILLAEAAHLAEQAGEDESADRCFAEAAADEAGRGAGELGRLRVALRSGKREAERTALGRLALAFDGPLRHAARLREAELARAAGDTVGALQGLAEAADAESRATHALALLEAGRAEEAIAALDLAAPSLSIRRRLELSVELARTLEKGGRWSEAAGLYQRAVDESPEDEAALAALSRCLARAGRGEEQALSPAGRQREPARAARHLASAGHLDEAIALLGSALANQPAHLLLLEPYLELAFSGGRVAEAGLALSRAAGAIEEAGESAVARWWRERAARALARGGLVDSALAASEPLLGEGAAALFARRLRARLRPLDGEELGALAGALGTGAEAARRWAERGRLLEPTDPAQAESSFRQAQALRPDQSEATLGLALRFTAAADWPSLVEHHRALRELAGNRPEALVAALRLAEAAEAGGDIALTAQTLGEATSLDGEAERQPRRMLLARAAEAAQRAGDLPRAVDHGAAWVESSQDPAERLSGLMRLARQFDLRLGDADRATHLYRRALELRADSPLVVDELDGFLERRGHHELLAERALQQLREATAVGGRVAAYQKLARLDEEHRGDLDSAMHSHAAILEIDHTCHSSYRALERQFVAHGRWAELVHLYDQLGLATADARLAAAVILERARLREMIGTQDDNIASDYRQALFKDGRSRPALRRVLAAAIESRDPLGIAELSQRAAELPDTDPTSRAIFLCRAATAREENEHFEEAIRLYRAAIVASPGHLPGLRSLVRLAGATAANDLLVEVAEQLARQAATTEERVRAWLVAGAGAEDLLADGTRALAAYREALVAEPGNREAFQRRRRLLESRGEAAALAEALAARVEVEVQPPRRFALLLDLAALWRDRLGDRAAAQDVLRRALELFPEDTAALSQLADLYWDGQQWKEAAETLIRRARLESAPAALRDIFYRLGIIYTDHLPDSKRAVVSFTRVLQLETDNLVALEYLSNIHLQERDFRNALAVTVRLAAVEPDPGRKIVHLHRVAGIQEQGFRNLRAALDAHRAALEVDPRHLPSIRELAEFHQRHGDVASYRIHLDMAARNMRAAIARAPDDARAYHGLFQIHTLRRSTDQACLVAGLLQGLGLADEEESALLGRFPPRGAGSSLVGTLGSAGEPLIDELLFPPTIPAGFRHLFRLLDETLEKAMRGDLRRLGIGKHEKLPRSGHAIRDLANRLAADFGVREFDLYLTSAVPGVAVELGDPVAILVGERLVTGAHELEAKFHLGGVLRMLRSWMAVPLHLDGDQLALLVGGLVRQFVPDFVPSGVAEAAVAAEALRLAKVVPRRLHGELRTFALECADPSFDLRNLRGALDVAALRAGLLTTGSVAHAVAAVKRRGSAELLGELRSLAIGDELEELRRAVGSSLESG